MRKSNICNRLTAIILSFAIIAVTSLPVCASDEWSWTQGQLPEDIKYGDVNNDGSVSSEDALELLYFLTGRYKKGAMNSAASDINKDDKTTVRDGLIILQNLARLRDDKLGYENAKSYLAPSNLYVPEGFSEGGEMLSATEPLAFYGADGYGKNTTGGRGGRVIEVTNLNPSGPGSFKEACESSGKRIIVFKVSGVIYLNGGGISVKGDCTIAGETAPGDGITIANHGIQLKENNIICRYISSRPGDQTGEQPDGIDVKAINDAIVDHCSASQAVDENLSIAAGVRDDKPVMCNRVTVQWCIISESITFSPNNGKRHGMGSIVTSGFDGRISYHHNFLSDNSSRNPIIRSSCDERDDVDGGTRHEIANNIVYNWMGDKASKTAVNGSTVEEDKTNMDKPSYKNLINVDLMNNYYKQGPDSTGNVMLSEGGMGSKLYISGNMMDGVMPEDQHSLIEFTPEVLQNPENEFYYKYGEYLSPDNYYLNSRFDDSKLVHLQSAEAAKDDLLKYVGNSLSRDTFDTGYIEQFKNKTGALINQTFESVGWIYEKPKATIGTRYYDEIQGMYPNKATYPGYADSDHDGMSDEWEDFMGLNKNDAADGAASYKGSQYTNLDVFLQYLVENPVTAID